MKNKQPKKSGTTYCLECKDYIHNFRLQEVNMTNKIFREESNYKFVSQINQDF